MNFLVMELRIRREHLAHPEAQIAANIGIDSQLLRDWERGEGEPSLMQAVAWGTALGLRLVYEPMEVLRGVEVDRDGNAWVDGKPIRLTPLERKALRRLCRSPGELVTHDDLAGYLYRKDYEPNRIGMAIRALMAKLRRLLDPIKIDSQQSRGYVVSNVKTTHRTRRSRSNRAGRVREEASSGTAVHMLAPKRNGVRQKKKAPGPGRNGSAESVIAVH